MKLWRDIVDSFAPICSKEPKWCAGDRTCVTGDTVPPRHPREVWVSWAAARERGRRRRRTGGVRIRRKADDSAHRPRELPPQLADLDDGLRVRIVRYVGHDRRRMRAEGALECLEGIETQMPDPRNGGGEPGAPPASPCSTTTRRTAVPRRFCTMGMWVRV